MTRIQKSTDGGARTHTSLRIPDFESSASANSATSALLKSGETRKPAQFCKPRGVPRTSIATNAARRSVGLCRSLRSVTAIGLPLRSTTLVVPAFPIPMCAELPSVWTGSISTRTFIPLNSPEILSMDVAASSIRPARAISSVCCTRAGFDARAVLVGACAALRGDGIRPLMGCEIRREISCEGLVGRGATDCGRWDGGAACGCCGAPSASRKRRRRSCSEAPAAVSAGRCGRGEGCCGALPDVFLLFSISQLMTPTTATTTTKTAFPSMEASGMISRLRVRAACRRWSRA